MAHLKASKDIQRPPRKGWNPDERIANKRRFRQFNRLACRMVAKGNGNEPKGEDA